MLEFIESTLFEKYRGDYFGDDEFAGFQLFLASNPDTGDLIRGSGGCRKIRWGAAGKGKRGGVRVIYFARLRSGQIWLLTIYAKSKQGNITADVLKALKSKLVDL